MVTTCMAIHQNGLYELIEKTRTVPSYIIRPLVSAADYEACLALQHEIWGPGFGEAVPPAILKVAQRLGGVAAGAFGEDRGLLGFVFGLTGVERGRVVHWSDMLAVRAGLRDAGVGRALKEWQREAAREVGAEVMYWTFDPLVARNAHLNFNRLGARAHEYVRDMYGEPSSTLHRGLGTDRLVVAWALCGDDEAGAAGPWLSAAGTRLVMIPGEGTKGAAREPSPTFLVPAGEPAVVVIPVPGDIHALVLRDPAEAAGWRTATRHAWEWALEHGYRVAGFYREHGQIAGHYRLVHS